MCGRFTLSAEYHELVERFHIEAGIQQDQYLPSFNIAPSHSVLAVIHDGKKNRLGYIKWGLIPPWAKDEKIGYKLINARAETITEKPSFRNAFMKRRCFVLADSFYEWKRHSDGTKTPMRIKLATNEVFAMAGLWEKWISPNGETIFSCTIITTTPNTLVKEIHDRMPVILSKENEKKWLSPTVIHSSFFRELVKPFPENKMEAYEVHPNVNSPKYNTPDLIQPI